MTDPFSDLPPKIRDRMRGLALIDGLGEEMERLARRFGDYRRAMLAQGFTEEQAWELVLRLHDRIMEEE